MTCSWRLWQNFPQVLNFSHFFLRPRTISSAVKGVKAQLQRLKIAIDMPRLPSLWIWSRKRSHISGGDFDICRSEILAVNCVPSSYVQAMTGLSAYLVNQPLDILKFSSQKVKRSLTFIMFPHDGQQSKVQSMIFVTFARYFLSGLQLTSGYSSSIACAVQYVAAC